MTWAGATWLAFRGGRSDRLRIVLTVASTAVAAVFVLLAGAVVTPWDPASGAAYSNVELWTQDGLRGGTVLALALLCLPFLAFAAQCSRIGAPARERRFEDLARLGATRRELRRVAAIESGLASVGGVLLGLPLYALLAVVVGVVGGPVSMYRGISAVPVGTEWSPDALLLPTDRVPTWWVALPGLVLLPLLVTLSASVGAARRQDEGQRERSVRRRLTRSGAIAASGLVLGGILIYLLGAAVALPSIVWPLVLLVAVVLLALGAAGLAGELAVVAGARLAVGAGRADLLLAGRRMEARQRRGASRLTLLLGCLVGGAVLVLRADALAMSARQGDVGGFFAQTYLLLIVALGVATAGSALGLLVAEVEGIVERRRSLATAVAAGVPRGVIARAVVVEAVLPVVPAVVVTTLVGALFARIFVLALSEERSGLPAFDLVLFAGAVSLTAVLAAGLATLALPASTDVSEARVPA